jgi:4-amino-4-deoxy-L-arabinose transferase-like glycosyltransferase
MSAQAHRLLFAVVVFVYALGLRVQFLGRHPFHMDEALYAGFSSRIVHGDLLLTGGLNNDKPPLQPYLGAFGMALFGRSESAVRFMNCMVSALECGALCWFAWPMAGPILALTASALLAGAPLAVGYGSSGLMDGPMSLFLLLAFFLAVSQKPWAAGLCWALAAASKQTAWFFLPFFAFAVTWGSYAPHASFKNFARAAAWVLLPLFVWSALFQHPRLGMIFLMKANQPEVGPGWSGMGERISQWFGMGAGLYQEPQLFPLLLLSGLAGSLLLLWRWKDLPGQRAWALAGLFTPLCLILLAALKMRLFERYLLPAASFGALAAILPLADFSRGRPGLRLLALPLLGALLLANRQIQIPATQQGLGYAFNDGFDSACAELKRERPEGGVLYSAESGAHWMGNYYLGPNWTLHEDQNTENLLKAMAADAAARPFLLARQGRVPAPPKGWRYVSSNGFADWLILRMEALK